MTVWVLVVIPLLLTSLAIAVVALPRLIGTAWPVSASSKTC